jgi:hypothetical protein
MYFGIVLYSRHIYLRDTISLTRMERLVDKILMIIGQLEEELGNMMQNS